MKTKNKVIFAIIFAIYPLLIFLVIFHSSIFHTSYRYGIFRANIEDELHRARIELVEEIDSYISTVAPTSALSGRAVFNACDKHNIDIAFVLAQGELESHYATKGLAAKTNSVFNVLAYDGRTANDIIRSGHGFKDPDDSVEPYIKLLVKNYLVKGRTEYDLMNNFVNASGHRYASNENYEVQLRGIYKNINTNTCIPELIGEYNKFKILARK